MEGIGIGITIVGAIILIILLVSYIDPTYNKKGYQIGGGCLSFILFVFACVFMFEFNLWLGAIMVVAIIVTFLWYLEKVKYKG
jgi:hypothetical protein